MWKSNSMRNLLVDIFGILFAVFGGLLIKWRFSLDKFLLLWVGVFFLFVALLFGGLRLHIGGYEPMDTGWEFTDVLVNLPYLLFMFILPFDALVQIFNLITKEKYAARIKEALSFDSSDQPSQPSKPSKPSASPSSLATQYQQYLKNVQQPFAKRFSLEKELELEGITIKSATINDYDFIPDVRKIVEGILLFRIEDYESSISKLEDAIENIKIIADIYAQTALEEIIEFYKQEQVEQIVLGYAILAYQYFLYRKPSYKTKLFGKIRTNVLEEEQKDDDFDVEGFMKSFDEFSQHEGIGRGQTEQTIEHLVNASIALSPVIKSQDSKKYLAKLYQLLGDFACNLQEIQPKEKLSLNELQLAVASYKASVKFADMVGDKKTGSHSVKMTNRIYDIVPNPELLDGLIKLVSEEEIARKQKESEIRSLVQEVTDKHLGEFKGTKHEAKMGQWSYQCNDCGASWFTIFLSEDEEPDKMCPNCKGKNFQRTR